MRRLARKSTRAGEQHRAAAGGAVWEGERQVRISRRSARVPRGYVAEFCKPKGICTMMARSIYRSPLPAPKYPERYVLPTRGVNPLTLLDDASARCFLATSRGCRGTGSIRSRSQPSILGLPLMPADARNMRQGLVHAAGCTEAFCATKFWVLDTSVEEWLDGYSGPPVRVPRSLRWAFGGALIAASGAGASK